MIRRYRERISFALAGVAGSAISYTFVGASGADDPYISYFVADTLARTGKLSNYNGDAIEQSSSFAHVLILAALHVVTRVSVPLLAALLGFASFAGTVYMAGMWARRYSPSAGILASCMVGAAYPLVYWAAGGLETLLVPLFALMFLHMAHRACEEVAWTPRTLAWSAVVAFLFASVRPDALLILLAFLGILGVVVVTSMMAPRVSARLFPAVNAKGYVRLLASSVVAVAALEITRLAVFGELMPQPVNAKSGFRFALSDGWSYVRESLPPAWIAIPLAVLLGAGVSRVLATKSLMGWMSVTVAGGWLALVIGSGGDWMGMGRLLVSFYVLSLVLCAVGLVWGCEVVARVVAKTSRDVARKMAVATIGCGVLAAEITACVFLATNPGYFNSNLRTYLPISSEWSAFEGVTGSLQERSLPSDVPWYQRRNSSHLRDELFRRQLEPWLGEFLRTHPRDEPYTIGSVQAGMVPYYVFLKFPGKIRFIDMASLSTKDFSKCDDLEKSRFGTVIWVWQWRKWAGQCAPPLPDMFFGHGESDKNTIGEGYDIVVSQDLTLKWSDKTTFASLIFAVRQELLTE